VAGVFPQRNVGLEVNLSLSLPLTEGTLDMIQTGRINDVACMYRAHFTVLHFNRVGVTSIREDVPAFAEKFC